MKNPAAALPLGKWTPATVNGRKVRVRRTRAGIEVEVNAGRKNPAQCEMCGAIAGKKHHDPSAETIAAGKRGRLVKLAKQGGQMRCQECREGMRLLGRKNPSKKAEREWAVQDRWIKQTLANDENSTDAELVGHFVSQGVSPAIARQWVSKRDQYLRGSRNPKKRPAKKRAKKTAGKKRNGAIAEKYKRYPAGVLRALLDAPASVAGSQEKAAARAELKRRGHS